MNVSVYYRYYVCKYVYHINLVFCLAEDVDSVTGASTLTIVVVLYLGCTAMHLQLSDYIHKS